MARCSRHNRRMRKVWEGSTSALRRDIHAVRGGFIREVRMHLEGQVSSNSAFQRDASHRLGEIKALSPREPIAGLIPSQDSDLPPIDATATPSTVRISYRKRRQVVPESRDIPA